MRVALDKFARLGIETHLGADVAAGIRTALIQYAHKLESGRRSVALPRFLAIQPFPEQGEYSFDLTIDSQTEATLEEEAARQGTTMNLLAVHAVMVYMAELEFLDVVLSSSPRPRF